jgi:hypothetical protein
VMILASIIPQGASIIGTFDIKGSERDRKVQKVQPLTKRTMNSRIVYKDIDFENAFGTMEMPCRTQIFSSLYTISKMLCKHNIMDYSLLMVIVEPDKEL